MSNYWNDLDFIQHKQQDNQLDDLCKILAREINEEIDREILLSINNTMIEVQPRRLRAIWTVEAEQDLRAWSNVIE